MGVGVGWVGGLGLCFLIFTHFVVLAVVVGGGMYVVVDVVFEYYIIILSHTDCEPAPFGRSDREASVERGR